MMHQKTPCVHHHCWLVLRLAGATIAWILLDGQKADTLTPIKKIADLGASRRPDSMRCTNLKILSKAADSFWIFC